MTQLLKRDGSIEFDGEIDFDSDHNHIMEDGGVMEEDGATQLWDLSQLDVVQSRKCLVVYIKVGDDIEETYRVYPLQDVVIGRSKRAEIKLEGTGISRLHCKLSFADEIPAIEDLDSKNGILVNGVKTRQAKLNSDDTFIVGKYEFVVKVEDEGEQTTDPLDMIDPEQVELFTSMFKREMISKASDANRHVLAGDLATMNLTTLLQVMESNERSGLLLINSIQEMGEIWLDQGSVSHCAFGKLEGRKAFYRIIGLKQGKFEYFNKSDKPPKVTIHQPMQELLLDALRQVDELPQYMESLPPMDAPLHFNPTMAVCLNKIPTFVFEVFTIISRGITMQGVIDACDQPDVEICRTLLMMIRQNIIKPGEVQTPTILDSCTNLAHAIDNLRDRDSEERPMDTKG